MYPSCGDLILDLEGVAGTLWYQTLYPRSGKATGEPQSIPGGKSQQVFRAPFEDGAWVLVLAARSPPIQPISGS